MLSVKGISAEDGSLKNISFNQQKLQKLAVAGETGSGKSTLLKTIAGLVQPDSGEIFFENDRVEGPAEKLVPGHPSIAYLSQHFEIPKFLRVEQVLEYANLLPDEEADEIYEIYQIEHLLSRKTDQLSGGERQRIALAKLLVTSPKLLLLDEPFSNLDITHKNVLKSVIERVSEELNISCILVSHDPADSLSWADEILIMRDGQIIQHGSPQKVYCNPLDEYVAGQLGEYNLFDAAEDKQLLAALGITGDRFMVRPEYFTILSFNVPDDHYLTGTIKRIRFFGGYFMAEVHVEGTNISVKILDNLLKVGQKVKLDINPSDIWDFNKVQSAAKE